MEKYQRKRLVGRGAYGTVYLGTQKSSGLPVILKEIPVDQMTVDERQASMTEAQVLSMLDHPNVVAYYESFLEDKTMIIVMEYMEGGTLYNYLNEREGKLLSEEEVLHYFGQMVFTLEHVHRKMIVHRDLKSQNILLSANKKTVKMGDFGISKVLSTKSKAFTVVGTPCYISPELCEGKPYNQKSDIWALGCLLYELMTLKKPFDAITLPALIMKIMRGSFDPVPDIYSPALKELLKSILHLEYDQRPTASQIMCQPIIIRAIFNVYMNLGAIPCTQKSLQECKSNSERESELDVGMSNLNLDVNRVNKRRESRSKQPKYDICLFDSTSKTVTVLPDPPQPDIKSVTIGFNQIIALTESGFLMNWKEIPHICVKLVLYFCSGILIRIIIIMLLDCFCGGFFLFVDC